MKSSLFSAGNKLDSLHQYMLSHLIKTNVKEFKHHKYDPKTNLVIFFNELIFSKWILGERAYKSLNEVIKQGLIPALAEFKVRKNKETDLIKAQLELEINTDQYLEKDQLDKAIEILFRVTLEEPTQQLGIDINQGEDGEYGLGLRGERGKEYKPGDSFNVVIQNAPNNIPQQDKGKISQMLAQVMRMPIALSEESLSRLGTG
jgi:hypothetical protein